MKQILSVAVILAFTFLGLTAFSIRENPQDPPRGKKGKKHIVLEKIDNKGNKTVLDTIIAGDKFLVWNGDTISKNGDLKWITKDKIDLDSITENLGIGFKYEFEDSDDDNVIILKSGKDGKNVIHEFATNGDSLKKIIVHIDKDDLEGDNDIMIWNDKGGDKAFFGPDFPHITPVPHVPPMAFKRKMDRNNIIDLSDPGIISYKKKKNKNGTEKITIIRKQVDENDAENIEKIIMAPKPENNVMFNGERPKQIKRVRVIKNENSDGKTWSVVEDDGDVQVIKKDGKLIKIREKKEGDEKKVEVEVEENKENN